MSIGKSTLPPQKESTKIIYPCSNGGSKAPGHGRTTAFWPSAALHRMVYRAQHLPAGSGKRLPSLPSIPPSLAEGKHGSATDLFPAGVPSFITLPSGLR